MCVSDHARLKFGMWTSAIASWNQLRGSFRGSLLLKDSTVIGPLFANASRASLQDLLIAISLTNSLLCLVPIGLAG
jgi:hypothetical protein